MKLFGAVLILVYSQTVSSSRILGIIPSPIYSHHVFIRPLWIELLNRGHELVLITTNSIKNGKLLNNLTEIELFSTHSIMEKYRVVEKITQSGGISLKLLDLGTRVMEEVIEHQLSDPRVEKLINNHNGEKFDIVIAEGLFPVMYSFSEIFNCPLISFLSMDAHSITYSMMGNPTHPVLFPDSVLGFPRDLSFKQRIISILYQLFMQYYYRIIYLPRFDLIKRRFFHTSSTTIEELQRRIDVLLVNFNPLLHGSRPLLPNTIPIGGSFYTDEVLELPQDVEAFLNSSSMGVIYFSLGSIIQSSSLESSSLEIILACFAELPYNILWKFDPTAVSVKLENVKIVKWLPQRSVLNHTTVKLFVTHGGLQSVMESIHGHVPMVVLPFGGDTISSAMKVASNGLGLHLEYKSLTKHGFKRAILEVFENNSYRDNVEKMSNLIKDQPMTDLETAVWWIEHVIRHKGASHLKNPKDYYETFPLYFGIVSIITVSLVICMGKCALYVGNSK